MDQVDSKILNKLQENGRMSMRQLAAELPMSVPAVCERVKKLEEAGTISGYSARISPQKSGRPISAIVLVTEEFSSSGELARFIERDTRIVECLSLLGRFNYCLRVCCRDMDEFFSLIDGLGRLGTAESYLIMHEVKAQRFEF